MKRSLIITSFLIYVFMAFSQVTIGMDESPMEGALLDLKQIQTAETGTDLESSKKGLLFPRVYLLDTNRLDPLIENASEADKKLATGMIVFNITINSSLNLNLGLYLWNGSEWVMIIDARTDAEFDDLNPADITVNGQYSKNEPLEQLNNLTININVIKKGKYNINAITEPYNGYYFRLSGEFDAVGNQQLTVPGFGKPASSTNDKGGELDNIVVEANNSPKVTVTNYVNHPGAEYNVVCNSINVFGTYVAGKPLVTDNYISLNLNVDPASAGEKYSITTNTTNNYSFHAEGTLAAGVQTVYLYSTGNPTPANPGTDNFTIITNSITDDPGTRCSFSINVAERYTFHIQGIGDYLYHFLGHDAKFSKAAIVNTDNYGVLGTYNRIKGFTWNFTNSSTDAQFRNSLNTTTNDIVIAGFSTNITACMTEALAAINSGRILIFCTQSPTHTNMAGVTTLIKSIFDGVTDSDISWQGENANAYTTYVQDASDPFLNGPFGCAYDINGRTPRFKALYGGNSGFKVNHPDFVPLVLQADGYARAFYHKRKGFIFFGDGSALKHLMLDPAAGDSEQEKTDKEALQILVLNMLAWCSDIRLNSY